MDEDGENQDLKAAELCASQSVTAMNWTAIHSCTTGSLGHKYGGGRRGGVGTPVLPGPLDISMGGRWGGSHPYHQVPLSL